MKFSPLEEYGLRCILQLARREPGTTMTLPEVADAEKISEANTAKIMRILREGGFVVSERGQSGGYRLAVPPGEIKVGEILAALGGRLYDKDFCRRFTGTLNICAHSGDCTVKSLWSLLQAAMDGILLNITLEDLATKKRLGPEHFSFDHLFDAQPKSNGHATSQPDDQRKVGV